MTGKSANLGRGLLNFTMGYSPTLHQEAAQQAQQAYEGRLNRMLGTAAMATLGTGSLAYLLRSAYLDRQKEKAKQRLLGARRSVLPLIMPRVKAAEGMISSVVSPVIDAAEDTVGSLANDAFSGMGSFLSGRNADKWYNMPLALPLVAAGTAAGGMGGFTLADYLAKKRRKDELKSELLEEQQKFEAMLRADRTTKASCAVEDLLDDIEQLCPLEKQAGIGAGALAGAGLTVAGALALLAAREGYKQRAKGTKSRALEQALREYRLLSHQLRPTPVTLSLPPSEIEEPEVAFA